MGLIRRVGLVGGGAEEKDPFAWVGDGFSKDFTDKASDDGHASVGEVAFPTPEPVSRVGRPRSQ